MTDQDLLAIRPEPEASKVTSPTKAVIMKPVQSLAEFWTDFRLSPNQNEHRILTSAIWLGLTAAGPIFLSILIAFLAVLVDTNGNPGQAASDIFYDLSDPIFVFLSLALFLGTMIYRFRWYPSIRPAFLSLHENHVLRNQKGEELGETEFVEFLEEFRKKLHSRRRYLIPLMLGSMFFVTSLTITILRSFWTLPEGRSGIGLVLYFMAVLPRWFIGPLAWAFLGGLMLWTIYATTSTVRGITLRFPINVQPLHSDKAGGLRRLGDLCSNVGLIVLVVTIPAIYLTTQGLIAGSIRTACAVDFAPLAVGLESSLTQERLEDCVYYALGGFNGSASRDVISTWLLSEKKEGFSINESARRFLQTNPGIFTPARIQARLSIFYAMLGGSLGMLVFAFAIVVRPLWDVHEGMLDFLLRRERDINDRVSSLYSDMNDLIHQDRLDEADKIKSKIKFLSEELDEVEKYPRWPIRSRRVLRSYLSSGVLSALVTFGVSFFKFSVNPAFMDLIIQSLKTLVGS